MGSDCCANCDFIPPTPVNNFQSGSSRRHFANFRLDAMHSCSIGCSNTGLFHNFLRFSSATVQLLLVMRRVPLQELRMAAKTGGFRIVRGWNMGRRTVPNPEIICLFSGLFFSAILVLIHQYSRWTRYMNFNRVWKRYRINVMINESIYNLRLIEIAVEARMETSRNWTM